VPAKDHVQALIQEVAASGLSIDQLRGVALYDLEKDARLTALTSFGDAETAIVQIPQFVARFGAGNVTRVTLQFVYEYFEQINSVRYEDTAFNTFWEGSAEGS
jgi:hypothetical protein